MAIESNPAPSPLTSRNSRFHFRRLVSRLHSNSSSQFSADSRSTLSRTSSDTSKSDVSLPDLPPPPTSDAREFKLPTSPPASYQGPRRQDSAQDFFTSGPLTSHPFVPPPTQEVDLINDLPQLPTLEPTTSASTDTSETAANAARQWAEEHPLVAPAQLSTGLVNEVIQGMLHLRAPPGLRCNLMTRRPGSQTLRTTAGTPDAVLATTLPMYSARRANPGWTKRPYTVYYEVLIRRLDGRTSRGGAVDAAVALGFGAAPYPVFRLPGWERASIGVHSDDGRLYVIDSRGGKEFVTPFGAGDVVGLGMTMRPSRASVDRDWGGNAVECFFTRGGEKIASWNLWENPGGDPAGLGGDRDLHGMIGLCGGVDIEFRARRDEWLYQPEPNWDTQGHSVGWMPAMV